MRDGGEQVIPGMRNVKDIGIKWENCYIHFYLAGKQRVSREAVRQAKGRVLRALQATKRSLNFIPTGSRKSLKVCKQRGSINRYVFKEIHPK